MSVNRKVAVPAGVIAGAAVIRRLRRHRRLSDGGLPSGRAAAARARARPPARRAGSSRSTASKSQTRGRGRSSGRRRRPARRAAGRRAPTAPRRTRPARAGRSISPSRTTRAPPVDDDEEAGPDLALARDDVVRREVDLDRARRDPRHARRRRRRRTGRPLASSSTRRSAVRVMRPSGCRLEAARPPCCAARTAGVNRAGLRTMPPSRDVSMTRRRREPGWPAERNWWMPSPASRCSRT